MENRVVHERWAKVEADWLVVGCGQDSSFSGPLAELNEDLGGKLERLKQLGDFSGKPGETLAIPDVKGLAAKRLLLVGLGKTAELSKARVEKALMTAVRQISARDKMTVAIAHAKLGKSLTNADVAQIAGTVAVVGSVGQGLYHKEQKRFPLAGVLYAASSAREAKSLTPTLQKGILLGEAMNIARELVNRPASEIFPSTMATYAENVARQTGLECKVLDEHDLVHEKMDSLLAVAQGSDQPPRMVVLKHLKGPKNGPTLALVGKGVTFDSGGLSIKSNDNMLTMKCDMAGAATVLGAMAAIARLDLPVNVIGLMGCVENMVSGKSYKLGDILTARNGVTIEVQNTDAEGRLVLADVLSYTVDQGATYIVDMATLTGACVVALGEEVAGAFANNQELCDRVLAAADGTGELVWQMPMFDLFDELIQSDVADVRNIGGRWGGAITAAKFLERFVDGKPWVHLDIAGPSFASSNKPAREGGATGCIVRTLVQLAENFTTK
ncbi:MAG: leucyl aminopeptidase [Planctomycetaceae bacterium]